MPIAGDLAFASNFTPPPPDPLQWRLFNEILDLFKEHRIRLVVNELEEAPHTYGHELVREKWRKFMRDWAQAAVEKRGFPYVRTDLSSLQDDDYFDYNHLNSKGVAKYSPMIADVIQTLNSR